MIVAHTENSYDGNAIKGLLANKLEMDKVYIHHLISITLVKLFIYVKFAHDVCYQQSIGNNFFVSLITNKRIRYTQP